MADGGDEGRLIAAGALKGILITLTLGDIAAKAHQAVAFPDAVVVRHFTDLKAGFTPVRVIQPLFIGQRDVVAEDFSSVSMTLAAASSEYTSWGFRWISCFSLLPVSSSIARLQPENSLSSLR